MSLVVLTLQTAVSANPGQLYRLQGEDPPVEKLLESRAVVVGQRFGRGPVPGARVVVDHQRLERLTGRLARLDTANITGIQHQAGHGNRRHMNTRHWARWYQEDRNTQIFRLHKGDWQFRDRSREEARPGRIEALTRDLVVQSGTWREWEGTYTFVKPIGAVVFQMFHSGGQLWAFHLNVNENGTLTLNRRRDIPGREKRIVIAEKMIGRPIGIRIRSDGYNYEIYKKRTLVDRDWEMVTDGFYSRAKDNKIQFRWGMYLGQGKRLVPDDALFFVSGTTIRTVPKTSHKPGEQPAARGEPGRSDPLRTWTDLDGRTIKARMLRRDGDKITIEREDSQVFTFALERLSSEDREFVRKNVPSE